MHVGVSTHRWRRATSAAAVLTVSVLAHAAHPLDTEDTATQGAGNIELENGFVRGRAAGVVTSGYQLQGSLGRTATLDLILQPSWVRQRRGVEPGRSGFGDTNLD